MSVQMKIYFYNFIFNLTAPKTHGPKLFTENLCIVFFSRLQWSIHKVKITGYNIWKESEFKHVSEALLTFHQMSCTALKWVCVNCKIRPTKNCDLLIIAATQECQHLFININKWSENKNVVKQNLFIRRSSSVNPSVCGMKLSNIIWIWNCSYCNWTT